MRMRVAPVAVAVVATLVVLSGCSGGDESGTGADTTPPTTMPATTTPATTAPATTTPATTDPGESAWCLLRREIDSFGDSVDDSQLADPEMARQFFGHQLALVQQSVDVAPPEVAADVEVFFAATTDIVTVLEANGFNLLTADLSAFDTPEIEDARQRLRDYDAEVCGIVDDSTGDLNLGDGSIADQFVAELVGEGFAEDEARCIFGELDFTDPQGLTDAAVVAAFDACGIDESRLNEIGV